MTANAKVSALDLLTEAWDRRHQIALEWQREGGRVVGCLGEEVPEELLIAAGCLPVRIVGADETGTPLADQYLERGFDPYVRARFEPIVNGTYRYVDHLIISNSSDALIRVYYYLRAIRSMEPEKPVPDLTFYDMLHTPSRMSALYNRDRTRELKKRIESWIGREITRDDLAQAIEVCNEYRRLLSRVSELRTAREPKLTGTQALRIFRASQVMPRAECGALLRRLLAEAEQGPPRHGIRLFVAGSAQDQTDLYELAEECGAVVVGEDHEWGGRLIRPLTDPSADPIDAIVDRYHLRLPASTKATVSQRVRALQEEVSACRAQAVLFFIRESDDAPSWDVPEQRSMLDALGIPSLLIDRQPYRVEREPLRERIRMFVESVRNDAVRGRD